MYDPSKIVTWLAENFQPIRGSRRKTLAALVASAMKMQGTGVLALGRAMDGPTFPKHRIKRVDRFLGNERMEVETVFQGLFSLLRGSQKRPVVLVDWTDRRVYKQLVFALSKSGRALPFLCITIKKAELEERYRKPNSSALRGASRWRWAPSSAPWWTSWRRISEPTKRSWAGSSTRTRW